MDAYDLDILRFLPAHNNRRFLLDRVREVPGELQHQCLRVSDFFIIIINEKYFCNSFDTDEAENLIFMHDSKLKKKNCSSRNPFKIGLNFLLLLF